MSSTWRRATLVALVFPVALVAAAEPRAGQAPATEWGFRAPGTPSPALARQFTPRAAPAGTYEVMVLDTGIEAARKAVWEAARSAGAGPSTPEAWKIRALDPLEAFGEAGTYPRTTVARLYTGTRAQVVRAPVELGGRTRAAVTLVSPYPDPTLSRLVQGTMVIVMHLDNR